MNKFNRNKKLFETKHNNLLEKKTKQNKKISRKKCMKRFVLFIAIISYHTHKNTHTYIY